MLHKNEQTNITKTKTTPPPNIPQRNKTTKKIPQMKQRTLSSLEMKMFISINVLNTPICADLAACQHFLVHRVDDPSMSQPFHH